MYQWRESFRSQYSLYGDAQDELFRQPGRVVVSGHRGAKALWPENTLPGFELAIGLGVDSLETDVNFTRDGRCVICHDSTVDRTTDGTGVIRSYSLEDLRKLDAGAGFGDGEYAGKGLVIPTLEEFCQLVSQHPKLLLNVEIKDYGLDNVDQTMATLGAFELLGRCVITCFHASVLHYLRERYGIKTQGFLPERMKAYRPETEEDLYAVSMSMKDLTPEKTAEIRARGKVAWCWAPDTAEEVRRAVSCGATVLTCNDPRPAIEILHST